jgi:hypothetical protein
MALFCPDSVDWGNVADWVSGIATFLAAGIALYLGGLEQRREAEKRKQELAQREQDAQVFAEAIKPELTRLALATTEHRKALLGGDALNWPGFKASSMMMRLPVIDAAFDKVWLFNADTAKLVVSARAALIELQDMLRRYDDRENQLLGERDSLIILNVEIQRFTNAAYGNLLHFTKAASSEALPQGTRLTALENELVAWISSGAPLDRKPVLPHQRVTPRE